MISLIPGLRDFRDDDFIAVEKLWAEAGVGGADRAGPSSALGQSTPPWRLSPKARIGLAAPELIAAGRAGPSSALGQSPELIAAGRGDNLDCVHQTLLQGGKFFVVESAGELLGCCWLTFDGRRLYLHHMAVRKDCRRRGIGALLMERAIQLARERNVQLKLEVSEGNQAAIALYGKFQLKKLENYQVMIRRDTRSP